MARNQAKDEPTPSLHGACPGSGTTSSCPFCAGQELLYWCETCHQAVSEKRCPQCGLKARKIRGG